MNDLQLFNLVLDGRDLREIDERIEALARILSCKQIDIRTRLSGNVIRFRSFSGKDKAEVIQHKLIPLGIEAKIVFGTKQQVDRDLVEKYGMSKQTNDIDTNQSQKNTDSLNATETIESKQLEDKEINTSGCKKHTLKLEHLAIFGSVLLISDIGLTAYSINQNFELKKQLHRVIINVEDTNVIVGSSGVAEKLENIETQLGRIKQKLGVQMWP